MVTVIEGNWWKGLFKDDPVRPHIDWDKRITGNKKAFVLTHEDGIDAKAVICCAFCKDVPTTEEELDEEGDIAVFYTVWSYAKGGGRDIVFGATDWIQENMPHIKRFITLSPPTEMAEKFHLRNGAFKLQTNEKTVNFEYEV